MTSVDLAHAVEPEVRLAAQFLETLPSPRAPWAGLLSTWCAGRGLSEETTRTVRVAVFFLRMRGAGDRPRRRGRR